LCDVFDKHTQLEYAGIDVIRIPHIHPSIFIIAELVAINLVSFAGSQGFAVLKCGLILRWSVSLFFL
jgi:hypothetical protein